MNIDELERDDRIRVRLTPKNSAVDEEIEVDALVLTAPGPYREVYCEVWIKHDGDILTPWPHTERWVGFIEEQDILEKLESELMNLPEQVQGALKIGDFKEEPNETRTTRTD